MDFERQNREELIAGLAPGFDCFQEVCLDHALFSDVGLRADVVGVPKNDELSGYVFAFEVKAPKSDWGYGTWCENIKQAHDYMYARVNDDRYPSLKRRIVSCSFLYPVPPHCLREENRVPSPYIGQRDEVLATGAFHMGLHLRVGRCYWEKEPPYRRLVLAFGHNDVWNSSEGFVQRGVGLVQGKRKIGSRKIDVLNHLRT